MMLSMSLYSVDALILSCRVSSALSGARQLETGEISTLFLDVASAGWREPPGTLAEDVHCGEFILMRAAFCVSQPLRSLRLSL